MMRLGPPPINKPLRGFLDFLGIKNGGQNPQAVFPQIQPTMDLQRWYQESAAEVSTTNRIVLASESTTGWSLLGGTPALPSADPTELRVPPSEVWLLLPGTSVRATLNNVAGQAIEVDLAATQLGNHWVSLLSGPRTGSGGSATFGNVGLSKSAFEPVWVPPGWDIRGWHYGALVAAGGQIDLKVTLRVLRMLL